MAINHIYAPDPQFAAQAISQAGAAEYQQGQDDRLRAIEQFNAQLEQRDRQFYDNLAYQQDGQLLDYVSNQDRLAFSGAQADQNRQAGLAEAEMRNQYGLADTALRGNLQAAMQGRESAGMMARDMQETRLKQAMSEHDAIQKAWLEGEHFTSDDQFKQAKGAWEQKWGSLGLSWGLPDQIAQQQAQQNDEMKVGQIETSFFTNPIDGKPLISEGAVQSMLELGMEPKEIATLGVKMQAEARQRAALQQQPVEKEKEREDKKIVAAQDVYKYGQQAMGDYKQAEADYAGKVAEYANEQAAHELAMSEWEAAKKEWAAQPAPADGKAKKPFSQKRPTFTKVMPVAPMPMQFAGSTGFPVARSVEEVQMKLASGEWTEGTPFLTPDGRVKFARIKEQQ